MIEPNGFHYCSEDTFKKIIEGKTFRLYGCNNMNDTSEYINVLNLYNEVRHEKKHEYPFLEQLPMLEKFTLETVIPHYSCFCKEANKASMWERYANYASGVAIGTNFTWLGIHSGGFYVPKGDAARKKENELLQSLAGLSQEEKEWFATQQNASFESQKSEVPIPISSDAEPISIGWSSVDYDKSKQKEHLLSVLIKDIQPKIGYLDIPQYLEQILLMYSVFYKHESFGDENEKRIILRPYETKIGEAHAVRGFAITENGEPFRTYSIISGQKDDGNKSFFELDFSRNTLSNAIPVIYLGSNCSMTENECRNLLDTHGFNKTTIIHSDVPLRGK